MRHPFKILIGLMVVLLAAYLIYREVFRPSSSVAKREADIVVSASQLASEYGEDEQAGNEKYLGKILQVSGEIHEIEGGTPLTVVLKGTTLTQIRVELQDQPAAMPAEGETVQVIGRCSGILLDVVLNNAAIVDN